MAKKKLEIKATDEQLDRMYQVLKAGTPLPLALQTVGISMATYYYWVAIASIVVTAKSQQEIEEMEEIARSGVSIQEVRDLAAAASTGRKTDIGTYIEPSGESLLQYKNSRKFKKFADACYEIVSKCNAARSEFASLQLLKIARSTDKKNGINPSGAMWWLERNLPDYFAKPSDKLRESENSEVAPISGVQVEFIDPGTIDTTQRLLDIEKEILDGYKKKDDA